MTPLLYAALLKCKKETDTRWGICKNVTDYIRAANIDYELKAATMHEIAIELDALMDKWPDKVVDKSQRYAAYPVEGDFRIYDRDQAQGILWQNPRRIALLDWLMEQ